jgi:hypothetical protein
MGIPPGRPAVRDPLVLTSLVTSGAALLVAVATLLIVIRNDGSANATPRAAPSEAPPAGTPGVPPDGGPPGGLPDDDPPSSGPPSRRPTPQVTRLPWRSEKLRDGSTRMVVGDIDAAPSGRPGRIREHYQITRSSWSGMRGYIAVRETAWTPAQTQRSGALAVPCPSGRPGTYDYQLSVTLEIEGRPFSADATAKSDDRYRGDRGTGIS